MKNSKKALLCLLSCALAVTGCKTQKEPAVADNAMLVRSTQTLDSLYAHYSAPGTCLLRENYPSDVEGYTATYLASEEQKNRPNLYSYLWPYSGTFSAVNALMEATKDNKKDFGNYQKLLDEKVRIRFWRIHAFQACLFNHSSTSPYEFSAFSATNVSFFFFS